MYLSEIIKLIGNYKFEDKKINKITIDSRVIEKDDIFICINTGYKYIMDAYKKGACLIITEMDTNYSNVPIIKVDNTIQILGIIAKYIRSKYTGTVIAITGSNGKTTTKELLSYILESKYKVLKNIGSKNNHIGIPTTLLELDNSYDYAVLELGTNHPGEIKYLTDIVKPNIGIITNIGSSHIGNFGNIDNILKEKLDIKSNNTTMFLNGEDKLLSNIDGIKVYLNSYNYICSIKHLQMDYNLVFKVCEYLKMNMNEIINRANTFNMASSRMNIMKIKGITLIDDSYNASYESVVAGLNSLNGKRNIIILGDMLELGDFSDYYHKKLEEEIKKIPNYYLITIGNNTEVIKSNKHFKDIEELIKYINTFKYETGDYIYIKGAHKMNLYKLIPVIKKILQNH